MCLSVPARVISADRGMAEVLLGSSILTVSTALLDNVKAGDYVLIHTGFAIEKIDPEDAHEMVRMLREIIETAEK